MEESVFQNQDIAPSLLRQIVDEVDALDREKQHLLLIHLRKDKLLAGAKLLDEKLKGNIIQLDEDEIADLVSEDRRKRYEQKVRH